MVLSKKGLNLKICCNSWKIQEEIRINWKLILLSSFTSLQKKTIKNVAEIPIKKDSRLLLWGQFPKYQNTNNLIQGRLTQRIQAIKFLQAGIRRLLGFPVLQVVKNLTRRENICERDTEWDKPWWNNFKSMKTLTKKNSSFIWKNTTNGCLLR